MPEPADFWGLTGNSGTTAGTHFVGTTDDQAVEVRVNNARALRLEPNAASPNLIGGHGSNSIGPGISVGPGVVGAVIAGGGNVAHPNAVAGSYGTVGGGENNTAGSNWATVGGGGNNTAGGRHATVGGGVDNVASGDCATVAGGDRNTARGRRSFAAGSRAKANHTGAFVWGDDTGGDFASTRDNQFNIRARGGTRIIKGRSGLSFTDAALEVQNQEASGESLLLRTHGPNNLNAVLKLLKHPGGLLGNDFLQCRDSDGFGPEVQRCHITRAGSFVGGSDFAEALPAVGGAAAYEPGDVLVLSAAVPGAVERAARPCDPRVAGVYSTRPGVLGADKGGETRVDPDDLPVAILGIVPTKASAENGPIASGDLLTTAGTPGHAMRAEPVEVQGVALYPTGAILGKALEPLQEGAGLIRVLVTLR